MSLLGVRIIGIFLWAVSAKFAWVEARFDNWPYQLGDLMRDRRLLAWTPPKLISDNYRYYQTGHDKQGRPVWVLEWGRWDMHRIVEKKYTNAFERYNRQMYAKIAISQTNGTLVSEDADYEPNLTVIIDAAGSTMDQFTSSETLEYILRMFRMFLPQMKLLKDKTYVINAHFLTENMLLLLRPILGDTLNGVKIYGTDRRKWLPVLKYNIPEESIPDL